MMNPFSLDCSRRQRARGFDLAYRDRLGLLVSCALVGALGIVGCGGQTPDASASPLVGDAPVETSADAVTVAMQRVPFSETVAAAKASMRQGGRVSMENALTRSEQARGLDYEDTLDSFVVGPTGPSSAVRYRARLIPGYPGLYEFVMNNTGSGWQEKFLLQVPPTMPTAPAPLLVVFHKYGTSHGDVLNTTFSAETQVRNWFMIAPLGARQRHYGNLESQINTRAAINLVRHLMPIDMTRIYGVGFSMGGGACAGYAAQHLDPAGAMFAAICDHTGSVSLGHTWFNEYDDSDLDDNVPLVGDNLEVPDVLEDLFGGNPTARPFEYARCSVIDLDPFTGTIHPNTDMARNLAHSPTLSWSASADPMTYLVNQTNAFASHIQPQNAAHAQFVTTDSIHQWWTLDETYVCNWLAQFTLQIPTFGSTLADRDGVYFHFQLEQDAALAFTPFTWLVDAALNELQLNATTNLKRLIVDSAACGLTLSASTLTARLSTSDSTGDIVTFQGVFAAPTSVTRDGLTDGGIHDAFTNTFTITENDGQPHVWVLTFP